MGVLRVANISSATDGGIGLGVARPTTPPQRKPMLVHGYTVSPRGADFATDVQVYFMPTYGGLGIEQIESGDFTADIGTAKYTSNFTADEDSWVDLGGGGPTFAGNVTVDGTDDCMTVTGTAGGDASSIKRALTVDNATQYKMVYDYHITTGGGLAAFGLGDNADAWYLAFDHDSGKHPAVTENAWQTDVTIYGLSDATDLEMAAFTAINNETRDVLVDTKVWTFKNIVVSEITNDGDWTRSADGEFAWDFYQGKLSADAGAGGTATYAGLNSLVTVDKIYQTSAVISSYVASDFNIDVGGLTLADMESNGTHTYHVVPSATTAYKLTADGDADGDVDSASLKVVKRADGAGMKLSDSTYDTSIRSGVAVPQTVTFPKPMICPEGWYMHFTKGGASCIMDINVFYEYM